MDKKDIIFIKKILKKKNISSGELKSNFRFINKYGKKEFIRINSKKKIIENIYLKYLKRLPDESGLNNYINILNTKDERYIINEIINSNEYKKIQNKNKIKIDFKNTLLKKHCLFLFCYNLDNLNKKYESIINFFSNKYNIIVTYYYGSEKSIKDVKFIKIKSDNSKIKNIKKLNKLILVNKLDYLNFKKFILIEDIDKLKNFNLESLFNKLFKSEKELITIEDYELLNNFQYKNNYSDNITDEGIENFCISSKILRVINKNNKLNNNKNILSRLIINMIPYFNIDLNLNIKYKSKNYNLKYSLYKSSKNYELIFQKNDNINKKNNIFILSSHFKKYTEFIFNNFLNNIFNKFDKSKCVIILVYSSDNNSENSIINKFKKIFELYNIIIVKDLDNNFYDFGKICIGYKVLEKFNFDYNYCHFINDSFFFESDKKSFLDSLKNILNKNEKEYIGILKSNQINTHFQSWWFILKKGFSNIYVREFLNKLEVNDLYYYEKIKNTNSDLVKRKMSSNNNFLVFNEISLCNEFIKIFNSTYLFDSESKKNFFYDDDKIYSLKFNNEFNIIKIKRIKNIPPRKKLFIKNLQKYEEIFKV